MSGNVAVDAITCRKGFWIRPPPAIYHPRTHDDMTLYEATFEWFVGSIPSENAL
jgi:hypothetical protein